MEGLAAHGMALHVLDEDRAMPLPPSSDTSRIAPACASVLRRIRASTAKSCGSSPPP